jgi:peptidyl-prolyl cis-trans isomerase C
VERGDLVEALETPAFALETGELSSVIETEFGFHLLMAEERQAAGVPSLEELRTEIEPRLRERYAEERYRKWMDELRKRSRVRVFL